MIDGRYEVTGVLGRGGMGVVLRARHRFTGAEVAVKLLHPHLRMRGDAVARFLAEARATAAIGHPGIVVVQDAGVGAEGDPFLVMELYAGETLARRIATRDLDLAEIRRVALEALGALGAAHAAGFVHRDLKPDNVFLVHPSGAVRLLDFGIAKGLSGDVGTTASEAVLGTVAYMSPEQIESSKHVDHRADLWALGVVVYEAATGALPYVAEGFGAMLLRILGGPPAPLAEHLHDPPRALEAFLRRALAVDPGARFASAAEMAAAVSALPDAPLRRLRPRSQISAEAPAVHAPVPTSSIRSSAPVSGPVIAAHLAPVRRPALASPPASAPTTGRARVAAWIAVPVLLVAGVVGAVARGLSAPPPADTAPRPPAPSASGAEGDGGPAARWVKEETGTRETLKIVWERSPGELYAVGGNGTILHTTDAGARWTREPSGTDADLTGVWGGQDGDVWVVGMWGTILHHAATSDRWVAEASPAGTTGLYGIGGLDGVLCVSGEDGTLLTKNGRGPWTRRASGTRARLYSVWAVSRDSLYVAGRQGTILGTLDGGAHWTAEPTGTTKNLHDVWANASSQVFAVGEEGTLLFSDGRDRWARVPIDTTHYLHSIGGPALDDLYISGGGGALFHSTDAGMHWQPMASGVGYDLLHVSSSRSGVRVAGMNGVILRLAQR